MTLLSGGEVIDFDPAKRRTLAHVKARAAATPAVPSALEQPAARRRASVVLTIPRAERHMRDVVWTAVISIVLASTAVLVGLIDAIWPHLNLIPLVQGAGLGSITFGLAGLSDKFDPHSRRTE